MRVLGIDIGSRAVKMVCMEDGDIVEEKILSTMKFYRDKGRTVDGEVTVDLENIGFIDIDFIVSTGYGRNNIRVKNAKVINELKAHTYGAIYQTKLEDFTLVDIGGQDFKVIKVEKSVMVDMILNDKCAASSGRYLENMARVLEVEIQELEMYSENPVELNTTCAVFGESELIGKISEGYGIEALSAGINYSLYKRVLPNVKKMRASRLVLTGGVASNGAIVKYFSDDFREVIVPEKTQLNGAIGCAYLGCKIRERRGSYE